MNIIINCTGKRKKFITLRTKTYCMQMFNCWYLLLNLIRCTIVGGDDYDDAIPRTIFVVRLRWEYSKTLFTKFNVKITPDAAITVFSLVFIVILWPFYA